MTFLMSAHYCSEPICWRKINIWLINSQSSSILQCVWLLWTLAVVGQRLALYVLLRAKQHPIYMQLQLAECSTDPAAQLVCLPYVQSQPASSSSAAEIGGLAVPRSCCIASQLALCSVWRPCPASSKLRHIIQHLSLSCLTIPHTHIYSIHFYISPSFYSIHLSPFHTHIYTFAVL